MRKQYMFIILLLAAVASAAAVISISKVDVLSNYKDISGNVWSVDFRVADGVTDSLLFSTSPQQIDTFTADASTIKNAFEVKATGIENQLVSKILVDNSKPQVFKIGQVHRICWFYETGGSNKCIDDWFASSVCNVIDHNTGVKIGTIKHDSIRAEGLCPQRVETLGTLGVISSPDVIFSVDFSVSVPSCTDTQCTEKATLTNKQNAGSSTKLGKYTWVEWLGGLSSGRQPQQPTQELALNSPAEGWFVIDRSTYETGYTERLRDGGTLDLCYYNAFVTGGMDATNCNTQFNNAATAAATKKLVSNSLYLSQGDSRTVSGGLNSGLVTFDFTKNLINFQDFRLLLSQDVKWVGINKPTGDPQIVSLSSPKFREGTSGYVNVQVRNKGTAEGSFELWTSCTSQNANTQFAMVGINQRFNLAPGASSNRQLEISMASSTLSAVESGTCKVYFKETTTQVQVTADVSVSADQLFNCNTGDLQCVGNKLYTCNDAKTNVDKLVEDCEATNKYCGKTGSGIPQCIARDSSCAGSGERPSLLKPCCENLKENSAGICMADDDGVKFDINMILMGVAGILAIVFVYLFVTKKI